MLLAPLTGHFILFFQQQSAWHQISEGDLCSNVLWQLSQIHICTAASQRVTTVSSLILCWSSVITGGFLQRGRSGVAYGVMSRLEHTAVLSASTGNCANTPFHIYVSLPRGQRMTMDDILFFLTSVLSLWLIRFLCVLIQMFLSLFLVFHAH